MRFNHCRSNFSDIPHAHSGGDQDAHGGVKAQTHTFTNFPNQEDSEEEDKADVRTVRQTIARPLANASAFWAGRVENWPGQVKFCIEYITSICFRASAPEI